MVLARDARITCPHCEREFSLSEGFARNALEHLEQQSDAVLAAVREEERRAAEKRSQALQAERERDFQAALAEARKAAEQHFAAQMAELQRQAAEERERVRALQAEQLQLREERRRLQAEKEAMALEVQRQVDARLAESLNAVRLQEQEKARLEKAELQKRLEDATAHVADMKRQLEQGSQQLQGEVLELDLEESLRRAFPLDVFEEVRKGARGGDLIQRVMTRGGQEAGVILWETKRAKDWSPQWCVKLKEDMRACGAAVGVLVTTPGALPRDWPADCLFGIHEEIWITHGITAKSVAEALREGLIQVHRQRLAAAGKGEKMEALYDYLTSPQFAQKLRAVYETFQKLREDLESERNSMLQRWARREKQLQAGVQQLLGIGGEIQGLAQQELPMLELEDDAGSSDAR